MKITQVTKLTPALLAASYRSTFIPTPKSNSFPEDAVEGFFYVAEGIYCNVGHAIAFDRVSACFHATISGDNHEFSAWSRYTGDSPMALEVEPLMEAAARK